MGRVLVVDDHDSLRKGLVKALSNAGHDVEEAANGTVVFHANQTFTYNPNAGFAGTDTFTYTASDPSGATSTATVTITVTKRVATVTAGSGTKVYGSADPVLTPTSTGFNAGDGIVVGVVGALFEAEADERRAQRAVLDERAGRARPPSAISMASVSPMLKCRNSVSPWPTRLVS